MTRRVLRAWLLILMLLVALPGCVSLHPFGHFVGDVETVWVGPRTMRLLKDFSYVDPQGTTWLAPKDSLIDGASIPRVLWTLVGSPYTGEYRNASVVHDVACERRDRPWQDVHRMFYNACRCGGVGEVKAKVMFAAVYRFGPRWNAHGERLLFVRTVPESLEFAQVRSYVESRNPSLEEIEQFNPAPITPARGPSIPKTK